MTGWTLDFEALRATIWPWWGSPCGARTRPARPVAESPWTESGGVGCTAARAPAR